MIRDAHFVAFIPSLSILIFKSKNEKNNEKKKKEKNDLTKDEKKKGLEFIKVKCGSGFLKFLEKLEPFQNDFLFFNPKIYKTVSDCVWWNSFYKI